MPVVDDQPISKPHDIRRQIVDRLPGSIPFHPYLGADGEGARDAKMAEDTLSAGNDAQQGRTL
jgi:hypothetical protein